MAFIFEVPGKPEPQRRARASARGGFARMHDDKKNLAYADRVRWAWRDAGGESFGADPVMVRIIAQFKRPVANWRKNGELSTSGLANPFVMKTPDADNIGKAICDALNGYAFADDKQVVKLIVDKEWAEDPTSEGRVLVGIERLTAHPMAAG